MHPQLNFWKNPCNSFIIFQEAKNVRLLIQARFEMTEVKMALWSWSLLYCPLAFATLHYLHQVDEWMLELDVDNNGKVSYEEFSKSLEKQINIVNWCWDSIFQNANKININYTLTLIYSFTYDNFEKTLRLYVWFKSVKALGPGSQQTGEVKGDVVVVVVRRGVVAQVAHDHNVLTQGKY